jgi:CxC5 like cysteine cluster associated with KDZ transposases
MLEPSLPTLLIIVVQVSPHVKQPSLCSYISTEYEMTHHNNYSVKGGECVYYPGVPIFIQVGEHQYVENMLANGWRAKMLLGW